MPHPPIQQPCRRPARALRAARRLALTCALACALSPALPTSALTPLSPKPAQAFLPAAPVVIELAAREGLLALAELVLERAGALDLIKSVGVELIAGAGRYVSELVPLMEPAVREGLCLIAPGRCGGGWLEQGLELLRREGMSMLLPMTLAAAQSSRDQHAEVLAGLAQLSTQASLGGLISGGLAVLSILQRERRAQELVNLVTRHHREALVKLDGEMGRLSGLLSQQISTLSRLERDHADELASQLEEALRCFERISSRSMPAQLSACLTQTGEAQTRLRQRGYWPRLELQLLEVELRLLSLMPAEHLNPKELRIVWRDISSLASPAARLEALDAAACAEQGGARAPRGLLREERGGPAPSGGCEPRGWLGEGLARALSAPRDLLRAEDDGRFEELYASLEGQMMSSLGLTREELRALEVGEGRAQMARRFARKWVEEALRELQEGRAGTLRLRVALTPLLAGRSLSVEFASDDAPLSAEKPSDDHYQMSNSRLSYMVELPLRGQSFSAQVTLTSVGYLYDSHATCALTLSAADVANLARRAEPLEGVMSCYDDSGDMYTSGVRYSLRSFFRAG
ncbi:MAG: hypothetical protein FJ138_05025 [Deltaproteobacteria bacterium]|nr:hypothetical protein [Deltaproteobacteria bacterium]